MAGIALERNGLDELINPETGETWRVTLTDRVQGHWGAWAIGPDNAWYRVFQMTPQSTIWAVKDR